MSMRCSDWLVLWAPAYEPKSHGVTVPLTAEPVTTPLKAHTTFATAFAVVIVVSSRNSSVTCLPPPVPLKYVTRPSTRVLPTAL